MKLKLLFHCFIPLRRLIRIETSPSPVLISITTPGTTVKRKAPDPPGKAVTAVLVSQCTESFTPAPQTHPTCMKDVRSAEQGPADPGSSVLVAVESLPHPTLQQQQQPSPPSSHHSNSAPVYPEELRAAPAACPGGCRKQSLKTPTEAHNPQQLKFGQTMLPLR